MEVLKLIGYSVLATIAVFGFIFIYDYDVNLYYLIVMSFSLFLLINLFCIIFYKKSAGQIIIYKINKLKLFTCKMIEEIEEEEELLA